MLTLTSTTGQMRLLNTEHNNALSRPRLYCKRWLPLHVTATWVCGFVFLVPTSLSAWGQFGLDLTVGSCTIIPDTSGRTAKEFLFVFAFLSPCLAIIVCYAR